MSSDEEEIYSDEEEQVDETLANSEVAVKYRAAAQIANSVVAKLISEATEGKSVLELCKTGDKLIVDATKGLYKSAKKMEKGIAFPTCISVNHVAGHFSPENGDTTTLKNGDVVKIDIGVHIDGFIAVSAHTHVVGNAQASPTQGKAADVICAAHIAGDAVIRLLKPGTKNTDIAPIVQAVADAFKVNTLEAVLSHQMKRGKIDGTKVIPNKIVADQSVEIYEIEENDVYAIDIVMSTGPGKTREENLRPTVYKRDQEQTYLLKLNAARKVFHEITEKHSTFPFSIRDFEDKHVRFGLAELEKHGLIHPYPVLYEKDGEIVAQFKYTALVGKSGAIRITEQPLPFVASQYSVEDPAVKELLSQSLATTLKKKKAKKAKKPKTAASDATPMEH